MSLNQVKNAVMVHANIATVRIELTHTAASPGHQIRDRCSAPMSTKLATNHFIAFDMPGSRAGDGGAAGPARAPTGDHPFACSTAAASRIRPTRGRSRHRRVMGPDSYLAFGISMVVFAVTGLLVGVVFDLTGIGANWTVSITMAVYGTLMGATALAMWVRQRR